MGEDYGKRVYECLEAISAGTASHRYVVLDKGFIFTTTSGGDMEPIEHAMALFTENYKEYCVDEGISMIDLLDDSVHRCPSCKSNKVLVFEMQTRSADEGATVTRICVQCLERF